LCDTRYNFLDLTLIPPTRIKRQIGA